MYLPQLLVPGGGLEQDGSIGLLTSQRIHLAAQQYRDHGAEKIVLAGGFSWHNDTEHGRSEAEVMAEAAEALKIPAGILTLEEVSTNTVTNILESRHHLDPDQMTGIITHRYHMPRVMRLGKKILGPNLHPLPVHYIHGPSVLVNELGSYGISRIITAGVAEGDYETIERRNQQIQGGMAWVHRRLARSS